MTVVELLAQIARRDNTRSEATLQADIRQLVLTAPLSLSAEDVVTADLETPVGVRRRIDIEVGSCLIEVKRDLSAGSVLPDAIEQLADYLAARQKETGCRYVGILTDGADWRCVCLPGVAEAGPPREVSAYKLSPTRPDPEPFLIWLEGVLATARDIPATPQEIGRRLGAGSSAHALDRDTLLQLFTRHRDHPAVRMKRRLWARLLTTALGTQFDDSDELFVEHTYLVNTAEIIAHALVGFDLQSIAPASLLSGSKFEESGISGVVEADFFDWVVHVPGGEPFVRSLARRVGRFRWQEVGGDVLKVLYESVITAPTRKRLGEYYTPDWLAERIVSTAVDTAAGNSGPRSVVRLRDLPVPCGPALPRRGRGRGPIAEVVTLRPDAACARHGPAPGGRDPGPSDLSTGHRPRPPHAPGPRRDPGARLSGRCGPVETGSRRPVLRRQPGRRDR